MCVRVFIIISFFSVKVLCECVVKCVHSGFSAMLLCLTAFDLWNLGWKTKRHHHHSSLRKKHGFWKSIILIMHAFSRHLRPPLSIIHPFPPSDSLNPRTKINYIQSPCWNQKVSILPSSRICALDESKHLVTQIAEVVAVHPQLAVRGIEQELVPYPWRRHSCRESRVRSVCHLFL